MRNALDTFHTGEILLSTHIVIVFFIVFLVRISWAQVVINEIMYHRPNDNLEYIELYNSGAQAVDLGNWIVKDALDSHEFIIPPLTFIQAGGYIVITDDAELFQQTYGFESNLADLPFNLSNSGDTVRLIDNEGKIIDSVDYDDRSPWPENADGLGSSLERIHPLLPASFPASWSMSTENGTPGKRNSVYTEELPSLIYDVSHSPRIPSPQQPITVTARVLEVRGIITSVQLYYAWNGSTRYQTAIMKDDGQHGDGIAGDGLFGAIVDGGNAAGIFHFFIEVNNDAPVTSLLPVEGKEMPYLAVVENPLPNERVPVFRVVMLPNVQKDFLAKYQTDEYFPASFYEGDETYYRVHIRHRGRSRSQNGRFKIRFPHSQLFRDKIRRLNFNGTDTATILREYISYQLYQDAGLPNLESGLARFHINGLETRGTPYRVWIENPDAQFLQRRDFFKADDGNLYKTTLDGTPNNKATWRYVGEDPHLYNLCYIKQNNEEETDYSDIIRFCRVLSQSDTWDDDYLEKVHSVINPDDFLRWMAVSACVAHWDSPFTDHGHNYVLYNNPGTGQFHVIAWDLNGTFNYTSNQNDLNYRKLYTHIRSTKFPAINKILNHPVFGAQYYRQIDEMLNTIFSQAAVDRKVEDARIALQLNASAVSFLRTYTAQRIKDLSKWIDRDQGISFISKPTYQALVGETYRYRACAVDYRSGKGVTYRLDKGPAWMSLNARTGELLGTSAEEGMFEVSLSAVTEKGIVVTQEFGVQITNPAPRLMMTFNEDSGTANDLSIYGNNGELRGGAARVEGRLGKAVYLDGRNRYVEVPHNDSLNLTGSITVEAWIKPDSISNGNPVIVTKGNEEIFNYTLMLGYGPWNWDSMEPCFMPHPFDIENRVYYGRKEVEALLRPQRWVHIAGTYDSAKELVCVYANNRLIVESSNRALMPLNTRSLLIGLGSTRGFKGAVDDVKILPIAKQAYAAGLCVSRVDVSNRSPAQDRIALSLSPYRTDPVFTSDYCLYITSANRWIQFPSVRLEPGKSVIWWMDDLDVKNPLLSQETVALYPIESMGEARPETVLDQVVWGREFIQPSNDPGVLAGVWPRNRTISILEQPATLALKNFADNDEFDADWEVRPQSLEGPSVQLTIGDGEERTTNRTVPLHIQNQSGIDSSAWKMRVSSTLDLGTEWMDYRDSLPWTLEEGYNVVYLQVVDSAGNRSAVVTADIVFQSVGIDDWIRLD